MPFISRQGVFLSYFHVSCFIPPPTKYWLLELSCLRSFHMYDVPLGDHQLFFLSLTPLPPPFLALMMVKVSFQVPNIHRFPQFYFIKIGLTGMDLNPWLSIIITLSHSVPGLSIQGSVLSCNTLCSSRKENFKEWTEVQASVFPHPCCLPVRQPGLSHAHLSL